MSQGASRSSSMFDSTRPQRVSFSINAESGAGGQGEFLRQMTLAVEAMPGGVIYSRFSKSEKCRCVNLPFSGKFRFLYRILSSRVLPGRNDLLALLGDLDFDQKVADVVENTDVFDGVMGQCSGAFKILKRRNVKLVLTSLNTHIDYLIETMNEERRRLKIREPHFVHPRMRERALAEMELCDSIRVNSEWAKKTFVDRNIPAQKIDVIYPGVDAAWFRPVEKQDKIFRVLAVSTIDPRKGTYYLLRAFEEANIPDSELLLIGGTIGKWAQKMLNEFMRRMPNIRHRMCDVRNVPVEETYGAASVLVHPALEDGYGLVVLQALSCGIPVIVTRETGASELIEDGVNGFVVDRRSVEQLKNRLLTLASEYRLLNSMGRKAQQSVSHLSDHGFAENVVRFYGRLQNRHEYGSVVHG